MKILLTFTLLGSAVAVAFCQTPGDKDTAVKFINEYVHELSTFNEIRVASEKDAKKASANEQILNLINGAEKFQLELRAAIQNQKGFHFSDDPVDKLVPEITGVYQNKIEFWQQMSDISTQFLSQKEGVDYERRASITAGLPLKCQRYAPEWTT